MQKIPHQAARTGARDFQKYPARQISQQCCPVAHGTNLSINVDSRTLTTETLPPSINLQK